MLSRNILAAVLVAVVSFILFKQQISQRTGTSIRLRKDLNSSQDSVLVSSVPSTERLEPPEPSVTPTEAAPEEEHAADQPEMSVARAIRKVVFAAEIAEGNGARVRRSIGTSQVRNLTPFLMLDHFRIKWPTGRFDSHPHRGQETITYILKGGVDHEDFAGNKGTLTEGDLQFMTAGRGIVHAELPRNNPDGSESIGMQLWVDLPKELKSCEPRYRDLLAREIPSVDVDDGKAHIKVISGKSHGVDSVKDLAYTPVWYFDITLNPGATVTQPLPSGWTAFAYVIDGSVVLSDGIKRQKIDQYHNAIFEQDGDLVHLEAAPGATNSARLGKEAGVPLSPTPQSLPTTWTNHLQTKSSRRRHASGPTNHPVWPICRDEQRRSATSLL